MGTTTPARPADRRLGPDLVILEEISRGRHAGIWKALDGKAKRVVALKRLRRESAHDRELRARLVREGESLARIVHPNVMQVHEVVREPEPYYTMPVVDGRLLAEYRKRGPAPLRSLLSLGRDLADALGAIHSVGLVHRDLRPENVLVVQGRAVVFDLGLAKDLASLDDLTRASLCLQDPDYAAPETLRGEPATIGADLYALGIMLVEFALGKHPFRAADPVETVRRQLDAPVPDLAAARPDLPAAVANLLRSLVAKRRDQRPASAFAVLHALDALAKEAARTPAPAAR